MSLLSQASLVVVPSGYKEDVVYSVKPTDGSGDLTFTRASDGTRVNSSGLVENVPWNLLQQSNTFNTTWVLSNATVTSGQSGYDGTNNAWEFDASGIAQVSQSVSTSGIQTYSVYAKAGSENGLFLRANGGNNPRCFFNLDSGTIGNQAGGLIDSEMLNVGNGWYRCTIIYSDTTNEARIYVANNSGGFPTSGSIYIQDAQLNQGTLKPYFPTTDRQNVPRLDYSNGCPSLLLEPQRTNLLTYSEDFDNAAWNQNTATITTNTTVSPDGTQNADTATNIIATQIGQSQGGGIIGQSYTFSVWVKRLSGSGAIQIRDINNTAATIAVTSEWQRFQITGTASSTTLRAYFNVTTTGDSIAIWGAQLEAGSYATSYIPTTSASVTRVADECSKTGISSLIGQSEGTIFVEFDQSLIGQSATRRIFALSDGTTNNRITAYINSGNKIDFYVRNSGGDLFLGTASTAGNTKGVHKIAAVYKDQDYAVYFDGSSIISGTGTAGTIPACSRFDLANQLGANDLYEPINQAVLFKTRLTNAELAALTTL